jgi:hypothetical protein
MARWKVVRSAPKVVVQRIVSAGAERTFHPQLIQWGICAVETCGATFGGVVPAGALQAWRSAAR